MIDRVIFSVIFCALFFNSACAQTRIPKSVADLIPDYPARVELYAEQLRTWRDHQRMVDDDAKHEIPPPFKHEPYPEPFDFTAVMMAVGQDGTPNFEVYDDGPTPAQLLAAKKADLLNQIARAEQDELEWLVPAGKRREFEQREVDVLAADQERLSWFARARIFLGADRERLLAQIRPFRDTSFLRAQRENRQKISDVLRAASSMMSKVEDLTVDDVDAFKIAPFN